MKKAGEAETVPTPPPMAVPSTEKAAEASGEVAVESGPKEVSLQASGGLRVEVQPLIVPRLRSQIAERDLGSSRLLVRCPPAACGVQSAAEGYLQLDGHGPRPARSARPLTSLLPEDQEIAPGGHLVSAFVLSEEALLIDSQVFSSVEKVSGSMSPPTADEPSLDQACWMVLPQLTVNGPAAHNLELLSTVDPQIVDELDDESKSRVKVSYTVEGQGIRATGTFLLGVKAVLDQPPPGDLKVSVECILDQKSLGTAQRTITLNPELAPASKGP